MINLQKRIMPIGKTVPLGEVQEKQYEVYKCPELKDYQGRPGAMHAYRLPSLFMGNLVYPKRNMDNQGEF